MPLRLLSRFELLDVKALVPVLVLLAAPQSVMAQSGELPVRRQAVALRITSAAIDVDGRLNEAVWARVPPVAEFVQAEPEEDALPTDAMEVRFVYDDDALYVGARMHSESPAEIQAPMGRRDEGIDQAERFFVSLDTYLDRRTAYTFGVTAAGVRFDHYHATDNRGSSDRGFDPVWEARVSVDAQGWVAELRIPFNQLRFNAGEDQIWGLNIFRAVPSRNEEVYWSLVRRTDRVWASQFGELRGISGIRPTRRIEVLPYVAGSSAPDVAGAGHSTQTRTGLDAKMGLGPNVTLDAAFNPDFGQVEADPAEVNLSAFETFFPERRPFFLEGSRLLGAVGASQPWERASAGYFYSRRIGARPQGPASGEVVDYPDTSTILGAAKVTGRLPTGTSVGILNALTTEEFARPYAEEGTALDRIRVAPRTNYFLSRIQQEFGSAGSTAGFMVTSTHRDLAAGEPLAGLLTRTAFTASGDSLLRFRDGQYEVGMNLGFSRVAGEADAVARVQRSSARYFNRVDATHVRYDPARTSLTGASGGISAERAGGRHWLWQVSTEFTSPEFEVNDLGRLSTADSIAGSAGLEYRETQPGRLFRNYSIAVGHDREWNFARQLQGASIETEAQVTWHNFWRTAFTFEVDLPAQDQRLTRGGPVMGTAAGWATSARVGNSQAARTRVNARAEYSNNEDGGFAFETNMGLTLRPAARWQLTVGPSYEREVNERQYVTTLQQGRVDTYGRRYVFAFVDRTTMATEIRLNYTFKPDVNLQFYGEPFAASGRYYDHGELLAPGSRLRLAYETVETPAQEDGRLLVSDGLQQFTIPNRDFHLLSFRSNLVLRWEWRLGSALYVVWQQDREAPGERLGRAGVGDLLGSLGAAGQNIVAVKSTFWLGLR